MLVALSVLAWAEIASAQTQRTYHIDVEPEADAASVGMPDGKTLIDSGKNGHGSRIKTRWIWRA